MAGNRVLVAKVDQFMFGLQTIYDKGEMGPARQRIGFLPSSWSAIEEVDGACNGGHAEHNHLLEGRAKYAEVYPPLLCQANLFAAAWHAQS